MQDEVLSNCGIATFTTGFEYFCHHCLYFLWFFQMIRKSKNVISHLTFKNTFCSLKQQSQHSECTESDGNVTLSKASHKQQQQAT